MKRLKNDKNRRVRWLLRATLLLLSIVMFWLLQLRPLMLDSAIKLLRNRADQVINQAVLEVLNQTETGYNELMRVILNRDGKVIALRADTQAVNGLKASVALAIHEALEASKELALEVPFGTLCGLTMLSGLGPSVPCRAIGSSVPQVSLQYHFDGAGINQTLHSIMLNVTVPLSVTMPLQERDAEIKISFLVGETVLVGEVPDTYTNVISDPEVADDIFNYGDAG